MMNGSFHPSTVRRFPVIFTLAWLSTLVCGAQPGSAQEAAKAPRAGRPEVRPVAVWPQGPLDVIAAFDRSVDAEVRGLDRQNHLLLSKRPQAVPVPLGSLRIVGARAIDDGRTIILADRPPPADRPLWPPALDTAYNLSGVEAAWSERDNASDDHDGWAGGRGWTSMQPGG